MPSTTDQPQFCRDHAAECARLAARARSLDGKLGTSAHARASDPAGKEERRVTDPSGCGDGRMSLNPIAQARPWPHPLRYPFPRRNQQPDHLVRSQLRIEQAQFHQLLA